MMSNQLPSSYKFPPSKITAKPRVLFVLGVLWGENGITSHLLTLSKALIQHGWDVGLVTSLASGVEGAAEEAAGAIEKFQTCGIQCFSISFPALRLVFGSIVSTFSTLRSLNSVILQFQPDVLHVHSLSVAPYVQVMQLLHHFPYVSTCHLEPNPSRLSTKLNSFIKQRLSKIFGDRVIAVSSELEQFFQNTMKVPESNIRLIYHGLNDKYFYPPLLENRLKARENFGLKDSDHVICLIGRLSPVKGHNLLIRALAILKSEDIQPITLFAGKGYGQEEHDIRQAAEQAGVIGSIRFLGFTDTRSVLWASDIIGLPGQAKSEAFGLVIAEAMLCGIVPLRTPAAGAFDQIEDGVNGFIVPFDDAETLALRLKQLLENPALRSRMSQAALKVAQEKFTVEQMTQKTIELYQEVIQERKSAKSFKSF